MLSESLNPNRVSPPDRRGSSLVDVYKKLPLKIVSGEGVWLYDDKGRRYLDMYGGHAVAATGHGHPQLVSALKEQLDRLVFYSNFVGLEHQEEAAHLLVDELPSPLKKVFFVNSGTEAVENALKVARKATAKKGVIGFGGGFHGRTLGALAATGIDRYRKGLGTEVEGHFFVPWGDAAAVENLVSQAEIAAVIVEPVQSLAGVRVAELGFLQDLRRICSQKGVLLIFDELQTGGGRSGGSYTFAPRGGVVPDLLTLGKGIASGIPMAVCAMSLDLADGLNMGDLGTTFGGGPLACLALKTTLEILRDEDLMAEVETRHQEFCGLMAPWMPEVVQEVRGVGLLLGLKTVIPAARLQQELLKEGVLTGTSEDPSVLRLMPPLTIQKDHLQLFAQAFESVLKKVTPNL